jgi:hypothetical protein
MSFRRQPPQDSLDLLLDTMCNAFGGIILMAVMIALLARQVPRPSRGQQTDDAELLQRRITRASAEVERLRASLDDLNTRASSPALAERMTLAREQARLQAQLENAQAAARRGPGAASPAVDPAARLAQLRSQMEEAILQANSASNALAASKEDSARLQQRVADLERQLSQAKADSEQTLRLPREHQSSLIAFHVAVRYGLVYPLYDANLNRNTESVKWTPFKEDTFVEPRPGAGLDPARHPAAFTSLLSSLPKNRYYLSFYVYEDSWAAFNLAKQMALKSGLQYGWRPKESDDILLFSTGGSKVPVQ